MPDSPKNIEEKMNRMLNAWKNLAPSKKFGGMTLAQFEELINPAKEARTNIEEADNRRRQLIAERDRADEEFLQKAQLVVAGVLADPTEGEDSSLYEAFGYVRKSERRSGLTRKANAPEKTENK